MSSYRLAILTIDRSTILPLHYQYDETIASYRTVGFVRLSSVMVPEVIYLGIDTQAVRDSFLAEVLKQLGIPSQRARRMVQGAKHTGETPPATETHTSSRPTIEQSAQHQDWTLARVLDREDFSPTPAIGRCTRSARCFR